MLGFMSHEFEDAYIDLQKQYVDHLKAFPLKNVANGYRYAERSLKRWYSESEENTSNIKLIKKQIQRNYTKQLNRFKCSHFYKSSKDCSLFYL